MNDWVKLIKGEEEKLVHPGNVANHLRAGWTRADAPAAEQAQAVIQEVDQAIDTLVAEAAPEAPAESVEPTDPETFDVLRGPAKKPRKAKDS